MEASGSSSSSNLTRATSVVSSHSSRPKLTQEQSFQIAESLDHDHDEHTLDDHGAAENARPMKGMPWYVRADRMLATVHPQLYRRGAWLVQWVRGPRPKQDLPPLTPLLSRSYEWRGHTVKLRIESVWLKLTRPLTAWWLFWLLAAAYIISLAFFSRAQSFLTPASSFVDCTSAYWEENAGCGLDGEACAPFEDSDFQFRCPAQCNSVILENPRTVGDQQVEFVPLIVGGGDSRHTYRGDSFICAAATHAGIITDSKGGCGTLRLIGNFTDFVGTTQNGLTSIGFPSAFPMAFRFTRGDTLGHCTDLRDGALAFNVLITCLIFMVLRPKAIVAWWCLVCIGFWHISLFSQPRDAPPPIDDAFGTFLPALFVAYAFWRLAIRFTLPAFSKAPLEAAVWYLGPFWVGVLSNLTFEQIPIDRLVASDLRKRSGAITALVIILVVVIAIIINQIRVIRKTGWVPYYLAWYIAGGLTALVLALLPGLQFRLHHYIVAMVLMPLTAWPTRLCAIYQGLLLGLFLNGVAAFGFDAIVQTAADLARDGPQGTQLPAFATNSSTYNSSIPLNNQTIFWDALPTNSTFDGFALLVDDVERYMGTALNYTLDALQAGIPHFFRLAFTDGGDVGDFTMPATIWPNETFVDPLPGPS